MFFFKMNHILIFHNEHIYAEIKVHKSWLMLYAMISAQVYRRKEDNNSNQA